MSRTVVGIDIGAGSIRAAEVRKPGTKHAMVMRAGEVELSPGAVRAGDILEPNSVADALRRLWTTAGFKSKDVVIGVGNHKVISRELALPAMPLKRIRETLAFQVQDMLPVAVDQALLDFYPIRQKEGEGEEGDIVQGLLIAALKEPVEAKVDAVRLAGLNPVGVDLTPFALSRVLVHGRVAVGTTAIIDVGESTTIIVIARDAVPQFVRIVPSGGDDVTRVIVERLGVEASTAEELKRSVGLVAAPHAPEHITTHQYEIVLEIVFSVMSEMLSGLRNTLKYYSSNAGRDVDRVVLTGGVGSVEGFADALSELAQIPVTAGDPLGGFEQAPDSRHTADIDWKDLTVAVGLASGAVQR